MSEKRTGDELFRAWSATSPSFDTDAGRARFLDSISAGKTRLPRRNLLLAAAMAAALAAGAVLVWWRSWSTLSFTTAMGQGQTGTWLATDKANELPLVFSEGSQLVMAADSRGRVEQVGRAGASFLLERGEVRARVIHRLNTEWRFHAGPFEVQVTGTALGVEWDPTRERFAVHVEEGSVIVRGPSISEQQAVRAGQRCSIDLATRTVRISPSERRPPDDLDASVEVRDGSFVEAPTAPPHISATPRWSATALSGGWIKLEERGDYDAAYAAALNAGLASVLRACSADELLRLAQVARLTGHRDTEREALVTCRRRFPGTESAAIAAYELGRASSPSEASSWFDTYLGEQPSGALAREAAGRLVEARASAGDERGARDAAARYLARYPDGPYATLARRVLAGVHD
jgi:hypothetical protein